MSEPPDFRETWREVYTDYRSAQTIWGYATSTSILEIGVPLSRFGSLLFQFKFEEMNVYPCIPRDARFMKRTIPLNDNLTRRNQLIAIMRKILGLGKETALKWGIGRNFETGKILDQIAIRWVLNCSRQVSLSFLCLIGYLRALTRFDFRQGSRRRLALPEVIGAWSTRRAADSTI